MCVRHLGGVSSARVIRSVVSQGVLSDSMIKFVPPEFFLVVADMLLMTAQVLGVYNERSFRCMCMCVVTLLPCAVQFVFLFVPTVTGLKLASTLIGTLIRAMA